MALYTRNFLMVGSPKIARTCIKQRNSDIGFIFHKKKSRFFCDSCTFAYFVKVRYKNTAKCAREMGARGLNEPSS